MTVLLDSEMISGARHTALACGFAIQDDPLDHALGLALANPAARTPDEPAEPIGPDKGGGDAIFVARLSRRS
jgi:hypothetical protein